MSEAPERIYIKRGWSDAHDGVWNSTKNLRGDELPPDEDDMLYVPADALAALQAENDNLKAALDAQEQDAGLADGNLWRFWSRKAREVAKENERLRGALQKINVGEGWAALIARAALNREQSSTLEKGETP